MERVIRKTPRECHNFFFVSLSRLQVFKSPVGCCWSPPLPVSPGPGAADPEEGDDAHEELEKEDEEEYHEVEGAVVPEGLVGGPEPAEEGGRGEDKEVDEGQPEGLAHVTAGGHVQHAHHHVGEQQAGVGCRRGVQRERERC